MGKTQLVLEDDAAIVQALSLIGQRIEGIGEAVREVEVRHAYAEGCRIRLDGKASLEEGWMRKKSSGFFEAGGRVEGAAGGKVGAYCPVVSTAQLPSQPGPSGWLGRRAVWTGP